MYTTFCDVIYYLTHTYLYTAFCKENGLVAVANDIEFKGINETQVVLSEYYLEYFNLKQFDRKR